MMHLFWEYWNATLRFVEGMEFVHWAIGLAVLAAIGALCMRGFGIRGAS